MKTFFLHHCISQVPVIATADDYLQTIQRLKHFFNTLNIRTFNVFNGYKKHEVKDIKTIV